MKRPSRPGPPHEDLDPELLQLHDELLERADDPLERRRHVGEVRDPSSDDQHLAVGVLLLGHEREQRPRVVVRLLLGRRSRVLSIVGQLLGASQGADRVGVDDGGAAAGVAIVAVLTLRAMSEWEATEAARRTESS